MSDKNVGRLHVEISGDSSKLKRAAEDAKRSLKEVDKTAKESEGSSGTTVAEKALASLQNVTAMVSKSMNQSISSIGNTVSAVSDSFNKQRHAILDLNKPIDSVKTSIKGMTFSELSASSKMINREFEMMSNELSELQNKMRQIRKTGEGTSELGELRKRIKATSEEMTGLGERAKLVNSKLDEMNKKKLDGPKKSISDLGRSMQSTASQLTKNVSGSAARLAKLAATLLGVRTAYSLVSRSIREYIALDPELQAMTKSATASLGYALSPAIDLAVRGLMKLVEWLLIAIKYAMTFLNVMFGLKLSFRQAGKSAGGAGKAIGSAAKKINKELKQLAGFDELNILNKPDDSGGGGGAGGGGPVGIPTPGIIDVDPKGLEAFSKLVQKHADIMKKELQPFIDTMKSIDFMPLAKSFKKMGSAMHDTLKILGKAFVYVANNMVAPFFKWFIEDLSPVAIDVLTAAINVMNPILQAALNVGKAFWEGFLAPVASWTGGMIVDVLGWMAEKLELLATWMNENITLVEKIITVLAIFYASWKLAGTVIGFVNGAIQLWNTVGTIAAGVGKLLGGVMAFVTSPVGLLTLAIAGIITIGLLLIKNWDAIKAWWGPLWEQMKQIPTNAMNWLNNKIEGMRQWFSEKLAAIGNIWNMVMDGIFGKSTTIFTAVDGFIGGIIDGISNSFGLLGQIVGGVLGGVYQNVKNIFGNIQNVIQGLNKFISGIFSGDWKKAWSGVLQIFKGIMGGLSTIFKAPLNVIIGAMNVFLKGLNRIKIPKWVPGVGGYGFDFTPMSFLAKGAVVRRTNKGSHAVIGEGRYDEAVIPLGESPQFKEMKKGIAEEVKGDNEPSGGNGDLHITLYLPDGTPITKVIKDYNRYKERGGELSLKL